MNPALIGALTGAGGLGLVQLLRKMTQSKKDEEENGSPSVLNGALLGALLGSGAGVGLSYLRQPQQREDASPFSSSQIQGFLAGPAGGFNLNTLKRNAPLPAIDVNGSSALDFATRLPGESMKPVFPQPGRTVAWPLPTINPSTGSF